MVYFLNNKRIFAGFARLIYSFLINILLNKKFCIQPFIGNDGITKCFEQHDTIELTRCEEPTKFNIAACVIFLLV